MARLKKFSILCTILATLFVFSAIATASARQFEVPLYYGYIFESDHELRTWTLIRNIPNFDRQFQAKFMVVTGFDTARSASYVVLELEDGRRRALPLSAFSAQDQQYALEKNKQLRAERELAWQEIDLSGYTTQEWRDNNWTQSDYFRFKWGSDTSTGSRWFNESFREMNKDYFDMVFEFAAYELGFPVPYSDEAQKKKIDVDVLGTGIGEGWAFGGDAIWINADAMLEGSSVVPHEFGHVLQFYSGGFKDNPYVGWFWETHANWFAHQVIPHVNSAMDGYRDRTNYHLSSTRFNYGSYAFLQYITEHPKLGPDFVNRVWTESLRTYPNRNRRNQGPALEDPFQAMMRLGYEDGVFYHPERGFGDIIGEMAARNATWDYVFQYVYQNNLPKTRYSTIVLEEVPDKDGWYRPPYALAPQVYGYNTIELVPEKGAKKIEVNFQGIHVEEGADWRATIVVVDEKGVARYSRMWNYGVASIDITENDKEFYLVVAATPAVYSPVDAGAGFRAIVVYPYEVSFKGAKPSPSVVGYPAGTSLAGSFHPNGGGFVANTAKVEPTVYVGPNARVLGTARVSGNARIEDYAVVRDSAKVSGNAIIAGNALVADRVEVSENAVVRNAEVRGDLKIKGSARVLDGMYVAGRGTVTESATLIGRGTVFTTSDNRTADIGGGTIIGINSEWSAWQNGLVSGGVFYEYANTANHAIARPAYLYTHWDFDEPHQTLLKDKIYYSDGILRGDPVFTTDDDRNVLAFNGVDQYVVLGRDVAEFQNATIEIEVKWAGGEANQPIFDFGKDADNHFYLTPSNEDGKVALVVVKDGVKQELVGSEALPIGEWVRVMILIENGTARLFVGNELVAETDELLAHPREVASVANYLARSQDGKVLFEGMLDDFKVYSTALLIDKAWAKTIAPPFQTNLIPVGNTQTVTVRVNRLDGVDIPGVVLINYGDGWKEMTHVSSTGNFSVFNYSWVVEEAGTIEFEVQATDYLQTPENTVTAKGKFKAI
ncbi:MAG: hypothetical protein GX020_05230 [Firmicutes bacterium]|nr:hypothetical protein [Bacillota bacterium]